MRLAFTMFLLLPGLVAAQTVPFDSDRWSFAGAEHRVEEHLGRPALFLQNAKAVLEGVDMRADFRIKAWVAFDRHSRYNRIQPKGITGKSR